MSTNREKKQIDRIKDAMEFLSNAEKEAHEAILQWVESQLDANNLDLNHATKITRDIYRGIKYEHGELEYFDVVELNAQYE